MTFLPSVNPEDVFFETHLIEEASDKNQRESRRLGNRFTIGRPISYSLETLFADQEKQLSYEIRMQLEQYDFWLVRLVCTLHPKPRAAVNWFQFHVMLTYKDDGSTDKPIAYHYYPRKVVDQIEVTDSVEIAPKLEFAGVGVAAGKAGVALRYKTFEPKIMAGGLREPACYWQYTTGTGDKVLEGEREMDLIVRKRRDTRVEAILSIKGRGRVLGFVPAGINSQKKAYRFG